MKCLVKNETKDGRFIDFKSSFRHFTLQSFRFKRSRLSRTRIVRNFVT